MPAINPQRAARINEPAAYRALERAYAKAWQYLERLQKRLERRGRTVRTVVRSGRPAEEILGCAQAERVTLIAQAPSGRRPWHVLEHAAVESLQPPGIHQVRGGDDQWRRTLPLTSDSSAGLVATG